MAKVAFSTLGCKVNQYDTHVLKEKFLAWGWQIVATDDSPDLIVVNSCVVTNEAARQSRQRARQLKRKNPRTQILLTGCYPRAFPAEAGDIDGIDISLDNLRPDRLFNFLKGRFPSEMERVDNLVDPVNWLLHDFSDRARAMLKVQDGCESFCSYCIVPKARGKLKSKPLPLVLKEVNNLISKGFKEIVLTGIHLGHYGKDLPGRKQSLASMVIAILNETKLHRLRLSSLEIAELEEEFLALFKSFPALCRHLHLPLQSGSNRILRLMNRKYSREYFLARCNDVRRVCPDIALTTDVMVGFPGETETDFQATLKLMNEINFSDVHVFPYSRREDTKAAVMPNQIDNKTKKERAEILRRAGKRNGDNFKRRFLGENLEVLIEGYNPKNNYHFGTTKNYLKVFWISPQKLKRGKLIDIRLTEMTEMGIMGEDV